MTHFAKRNSWNLRVSAIRGTRKKIGQRSFEKCRQIFWRMPTQHAHVNLKLIAHRDDRASRAPSHDINLLD